MKQNGGVVMVNFYSGFIVPESGKKMRAVLAGAAAKYPDRAARAKAMEAWFRSEGSKLPRGTYRDVADHIDHIVKVAGIDHVGHRLRLRRHHHVAGGPGRRFRLPSPDRGAAAPRLQRGGHPQDPGSECSPAFRQAGEVAKHLRATTTPEVDEIKPEKRRG